MLPDPDFFRKKKWQNLFWKNQKNQLTYIKNVEGHSKSGKRSLQITYGHLSNGVDSKVYVDTFIPKEIHELEGHARNVFFHYNLYTCSNIYSGQIIKAKIIYFENLSLL
mgnify:CR=1 FL=1